MTRSFEAVFWDMDGTLVDSEPLHERALAASLKAEGLTAPQNLNEIVVGMSAVAIHGLFCKRYGLALSLERWVELYYRLYLDTIPELAPRDGALHVYAELDRHHVSQVVVSNSDRMIVDANLRATGVTRPGLKTVARNDVRLGKPDPEPFLRAAWLVGVPPEKAVVVEDSPLGAAAGLAAGMRTLFWPQKPIAGPEGAEWIGSIGELSQALGVDGASSLRRA